MTRDYNEECPRCHDDDITISSIDGYTCDRCGAWWDADDDGNLIWAYDHLPEQIFEV